MSRWRTSRITSFKNAFSGVWYNLRNEPNFLIQSIFAVLVVAAGIFFPIQKIEWIVLVISIGLVLSAEALNTSVEKICDRFLDKEDPSIKIIKDSAAAAVLITSLLSSVVGILLFLPYIVDFFKSII